MDSLDIIIVGAGIAGLSAAITIRRGGHNVKVYERSKLDNEFGAAIHVCPNASRSLLSWEFDVEGAKFLTAKYTYFADAESLHRTYESNLCDVEPTYGSPWYFAHRVDLHTELKRIATSETGLGKPVEINPSSTVVAYDAEAGSITLADTTVCTADLVVAADGVHSLATEAVLGYPNPALQTDQSVYRFLIPTSLIAANPETAHFIDGGDGCFRVFVGKGHKRLIWYPCRSNEVQNFVGFVPDRDMNSQEDWNAPANTEDFVSQFSEFHQSILAVCKKATNIKKWPLLFRAPIPTWHRSKLVLIGDAAHPMLPHQGQAGAQAIEDSVALGTMLSGLNKNNMNGESNLLSARLELFEQVRINRASAMQIFSNVGQDKGTTIEEAAKPYVKGKVPSNPMEFRAYNFGYDIMKDSLEVLRKSEQNVA